MLRMQINEVLVKEARSYGPGHPQVRPAERLHSLIRCRMADGHPNGRCRRDSVIRQRPKQSEPEHPNLGALPTKW